MSKPQAVDCVIGMSQAVTATAAREFTAAVYQALGFGKGIKDAFDLGIVQLGMSRTDEHIPWLDCHYSEEFSIGNRNLYDIYDIYNAPTNRVERIVFS